MRDKICAKKPNAPREEAFTPPEVLREFHSLAEYRREHMDFHMPYAEETRLLLCVKNGDPEGLRAILEDVGRHTGGSVSAMAPDALSRSRCGFMVGITLYTRFAVEGGLDQETAYNLSDAYIRAMLAMDEPERITALSTRSGLDFAARVREFRLSCGPAVKLCRDYISKHLHYKITLQELADACGLSPNYLSTLFRRQAGMGVQEYVMDAKLEAARHRLIASDDTVAQVASQFAFCSHSSFAAHFKKRYGVTPGQYRQEEHSTVWGVIE